MHGEKGNGGMVYKRYSTNMKKAVDYIERNIKNNVTYSQVAQAAAISKGHFWRLFKMLFGETIGSYIRNRRLTLTAQKLLLSQRKISDICYEYNFESHEAFTRAFKKLFGMAPVEYRKKRERFYCLERQKLADKDINHILGGGINTNPDFIKIKKFTVYGQIKKISAKRVIDGGLKKVLKLKKSNKSTFTAVCGCGRYIDRLSMDSPVELFTGTVAENTKRECGQAEKVMPAGKYARFIHKGSLLLIASSMDYIFGSWVRKSCKKGLKYYFILSENREKTENGFRAEIYIPAGIIKKAI